MLRRAFAQERLPLGGGQSLQQSGPNVNEIGRSLRASFPGTQTDSSPCRAACTLFVFHPHTPKQSPETGGGGKSKS